jgi:hypothetical protein
MKKRKLKQAIKLLSSVIEGAGNNIIDQLETAELTVTYCDEEVNLTKGENPEVILKETLEEYSDFSFDASNQSDDVEIIVKALNERESTDFTPNDLTIDSQWGTIPAVGQPAVTIYTLPFAPFEIIVIGNGYNYYVSKWYVFTDSREGNQLLSSMNFDNSSIYIRLKDGSEATFWSVDNELYEYEIAKVSGSLTEYFTETVYILRDDIEDVIGKSLD